MLSRLKRETLHKKPSILKLPLFSRKKCLLEKVRATKNDDFVLKIRKNLQWMKKVLKVNDRLSCFAFLRPIHATKILTVTVHKP